MRVPLIILMSTVWASTVHAQLATSATHQMESLAVTGGGGFALSATHQLQGAVGQSSPLAEGATVITSATNAVQPGVIPTLYPRTLIGDSNDDGDRDAADVVTSVEIGAGNQTAPAEVIPLFNADVNTDGQVNADDVTAVVDLLLGL